MDQDSNQKPQDADQMDVTSDASREEVEEKTILESDTPDDKEKGVVISEQIQDAQMSEQKEPETIPQSKEIDLPSTEPTNQDQERPIEEEEDLTRGRLVSKDQEKISDLERRIEMETKKHQMEISSYEQKMRSQEGRIQQQAHMVQQIQEQLQQQTYEIQQKRNQLQEQANEIQQLQNQLQQQAYETQQLQEHLQHYFSMGQNFQQRNQELEHEVTFWREKDEAEQNQKRQEEEARMAEERRLKELAERKRPYFLQNKVTKFLSMFSQLEQFGIPMQDIHEISFPNPRSCIYVVNHTARFETVNFSPQTWQKFGQEFPSVCRVLLFAMTLGTPHTVQSAPKKLSSGEPILTIFYDDNGLNHEYNQQAYQFIQSWFNADQ
eukprot:TRINITY_DN1393_c0_g1_i3.p1 TRINITY_DN1393_c0_g1~~TRINITY_DN1393_c0_g1_i3.p1  ORF type:complete len:379 (-),score=96.30 TRINITY_DN1393_c0_g1_i3:20-1156(-)